jgi:hypothetical protein
LLGDLGKVDLRLLRLEGDGDLQGRDLLALDDLQGGRTSPSSAASNSARVPG